MIKPPDEKTPLAPAASDPERGGAAVPVRKEPQGKKGRHAASIVNHNVKNDPSPDATGWENLRAKNSVHMAQFGFSARINAKKERTASKENFNSFVNHLNPLRQARDKYLPEYDEDASTMMILFTWYGTMFPLVLRKPLFWMMLSLHLSLCAIDGGWFNGWRPWDVDESIEFSLLTMPMNLLVFFAVFYASQCYNRFFEFYSQCVGVGARSMEWVGLVTLHLPRDGVLHWNCCRFILAAAHVQYYEVNSNKGLDDEEWQVIVARKLLSPEEANGVKGYSGYTPWLLLTWACQEVQAALLRTSSDADSRSEYEKVVIYERFESVALQLRCHFGTIWNLLKQPVPWAYYHLLVLLNFSILALLAYGMVGLGTWWVTLAVYTIATLSLMGLRELAVAMADPFGDDIIDFKLERFLEAIFKNTLAQLAVEREICSYNMVVSTPVDYANPEKA